METGIINQPLQEYGAYLSGGGFVPGKRVRFYVHWVERFLKSGAGAAALRDDDRRLRFLDELGSDGRINDWQLDQPDDAVKLYQRLFLGREGDEASVRGSAVSEEVRCPIGADALQALEQMREVIRVPRLVPRALSTSRPTARGEQPATASVPHPVTMFCWGTR